MKSPLRKLVAVVLAVLAGTFFSVRGYLDTLEPAAAFDLQRAGSVWSARLLDLESGVVPARAPESVQDDNCPTCKVTPARDGLELDLSAS